MLISVRSKGLKINISGGGVGCLSLPPVSMCLNAGAMGRIDAESETLIPQIGGCFDVAHALRADGFDASEDGTGRGTPIVAFSSKDYGAGAGSIAPTLRAMGHTGSHPNAGGQVAIAIQERAVSENPDAGPGGAGWRGDGAAYTLEARSTVQSVALRGREGGGTAELSDVPSALRASGGGGGGDKAHVLTSSVRRLTPRECERLQGFPDDYTLIDYRGKPAADGPRYKALGNSMAVPVIRWILNRIEIFERDVRPRIAA